MVIRSEGLISIDLFNIRKVVSMSMARGLNHLEVVWESIGSGDGGLAEVSVSAFKLGLNVSLDEQCGNRGGNGDQ